VEGKGRDGWMEEVRCISVRLVLAAFEVAMALLLTLRERESLSYTTVVWVFCFFWGVFFPFSLFIW
jgi:hypothetical protein